MGSTRKRQRLFGIKGKSPKGGTTSFTTCGFISGKEIITKDAFRAYPDFPEAAEDYGVFLTNNPRYKLCFTVSGDPFAFSDKLQAAGYATDPQYASRLKNIIRTYY